MPAITTTHHTGMEDEMAAWNIAEVTTPDPRRFETWGDSDRDPEGIRVPVYATVAPWEGAPEWELVALVHQDDGDDTWDVIGLRYFQPHAAGSTAFDLNDDLQWRMKLHLMALLAESVDFQRAAAAALNEERWGMGETWEDE